MPRDRPQADASYRRRMRTGLAAVAGTIVLAAGGGAALLVVVAAGRAASATRPVVLRSLQMVDAAQGYALSGQNPDAYRLLRTRDGGDRWTDITPRFHPSGPLSIVRPTTMFFSTKLRRGVYAVERSVDGGRSWQRSLPFTDRHGFGVGQPFAADARHLYVAVDEGAAAGSQNQALYTSADGGRRWHFVSRTDMSGKRPRTLPFGCDKDGFGFATPTRGWAGGYCAAGGPFFYRTDDGGRSWRRQPLSGVSACGCDTSAPRFFTRREGALFVLGFAMNGAGKPFVSVDWTADGGTHWRSSTLRTGRASVVSFADARTAWIVATPPGRIRGPFDRLFRTSDAGRHWQTTKLPFDAEYYQLDAVNATLAYAFRAVNGGSSVLRTRDGGRSWQTIRTQE
jgi:photosystem II stability/assembly factor-like uncharacterized protein